MRQISKKKITKFNYIHMYGNPTYMSGSETPKEIQSQKRQMGIYDILNEG